VWLNLNDNFPHPYAVSDADAFIQHAISQEPERLFAIATPDKAIGGIGLMPGELIHRFSAELGYWLGEPNWNKSIMSEAIGVLVAWAFEQTEIKRVCAKPYGRNKGSARVLEKNGFVLEGIMKASAFKDDRFEDQLVYAKVKE